MTERPADGALVVRDHRWLAAATELAERSLTERSRHRKLEQLVLWGGRELADITEVPSVAAGSPTSGMTGSPALRAEKVPPAVSMDARQQARPSGSMALAREVPVVDTPAEVIRARIGTPAEVIRARIGTPARTEAYDLGGVGTVPPGASVIYRAPDEVAYRAALNLREVGAEGFMAQVEARIEAWLAAREAGDDKMFYRGLVDRLADPGNPTMGSDLFVARQWSKGAKVVEGRWRAPYSAAKAEPEAMAARMREAARAEVEAMGRVAEVIGPDAPPLVGPGDAAIVAGPQRTIDPDYPARTGIDPDISPDQARMDALRDSGAQVFVTSADEVAQRTAQASAGLPVTGRGVSRVTILNDVDEAVYLRRLASQRDEANLKAAALRERLATQREAAEPAGTTLEVSLPPELRALYSAYVWGELADITEEPSVAAGFPTSGMTESPALRAEKVPPAVSMDARQQADPGGGVGEGRVGLYEPPRTREEAEAALDFIADYCDNCPIRARCAGEACAIWRAQDVAEAILDTPVVAGVPLREGIA